MTNAISAVAIDLGAASCRVSLATVKGGKISLRTIHSFPNGPIEIGGHLYWNLKAIENGVLEGLRKCAEIAPHAIGSIGVDGWAVDYVRLDRNRQPLDNPFCYRDPRTETTQKQLWTKIPAERIYSLTGIQHLRFNTLYQLYADLCDGLPRGAAWLNIPEYILEFLGGSPVAEYTNATHTQMLAVGQHRWCAEIFTAAGLDITIAPQIVPPGSPLGKLSRPLAMHPYFNDTLLIAPSCHDTGSAVAGIPATGDDWAFISSGTWSLVGAVLPKACTSADASRLNFSNEGGLRGQVRFLKNVNGMWLLEECLRHWEADGARLDRDALIEECARQPDPPVRFNVDSPALLLPGHMPDRIAETLVQNGGAPVPTDASHAPRIANLIFHSLAARYAGVLRDLASVTGKKINRIYVVGGGSRNEYLNQLIARETGLEVHRGAVESSTIGNLAVQCAVLSGEHDSETGVLPEAVAEWSQRLCSTLN